MFRRFPNRLIVVIIAFCVFAVGCSSTPEEVQSADGTDTSTPDDTDETDADSTTTSVKERTTTTKPVSTAVPTSVPLTSTAAWIDPADAVLAGLQIQGGAFDGSTSIFGGYDPGAVQTDCAPFTRFDGRVQFSGAMWTQNGTEFNLDHRVFDAGHMASGLQIAAGQVARECLTMQWLEGGEAVNEILPVELPKGWAGFRQSDVGTDQFLWVAVASRENILSVVTYVHWGHEPGVGDEQVFLAAVAAADRRLQSAPVIAPEPPELRPAPSTTVPGTRPTTTTVPISPPVTGPSPPETYDPFDPPEAGILEPLLFDETDLGATLIVEEISIDAVEFEGCKNADSFAGFFGSLQVVAVSVPDDFETYGVAQVVGISESPAIAAEALRFADELVPCAMDDGSLEISTIVRVKDLPDGVRGAVVFSGTESGGPVSYAMVQLDLHVSMFLGITGESEFSVDDLLDLAAARLPAFEVRVDECTAWFRSRTPGAATEPRADCDGIERYPG